jgi:hypothetical protein
MLFFPRIFDDQFAILNQENTQFSFLGIYTASTCVKYIGCPGDTVHEYLILLQYTTILQRNVYALLFHYITLCIKC